MIVVAPKFTKESFKYFALLEMAQSSESNKDESEYINNSISLILIHKSKFSLNNKHSMFGHSAGAQFT